ncbi:unnamed protein product [Lactuca saligna]|uniref:Uncharacterized protein n=1 Tax=Lactuca saligna TaxID=75948 RepID=A0AA35YJ71_LACSI|nr:unnamed protein product [Lactuca saligna]
MIAEFQVILAEADKGKKGGRGLKKATKKGAAKEGPTEGAKTPSKKQKAPIASTAAPKRSKQPAIRLISPTPSPSQSETKRLESDSVSEIRIEENQPIHSEDQGPLRNEEDEHVHNEPPVHTEVPPQDRENPPFHPKHLLHLPFQIRIDSEDEASTTKGDLKSLHEKIGQLILASKPSFSEAYSKAVVESILERLIKEHASNTSTMTKEVSDSADVCKSTTEKVDKLIANTIEFMEDYKTTYNSNTITANKAIQNVWGMFKAKRTNYDELCKGFQYDNKAFQSPIDVKISKLQE